jgi:hypothetical protein
MIKINLYEYQAHELLIILNEKIHEFKEEREKPENRCDLSFYEIKISVYERIRDILQDSLNKE